MRPLEILLILVLAARLTWPLISNRRPTWYYVLPLTALLTSLLHLALEGYRWQMLPLYLLTLILLLASIASLIRRPAPPTARRPRAVLGSVLGLLLLGVAAAPPALLPVPRLPEPTGPFAVGVFTLELTDNSRQERYAADPLQPRRFQVQIWYPAEPEPGSQPAAWVKDMSIFGPAITEWLELPSFFLDHIALARTHSYPDAPMAASGAPYPVLLFSHGWGGFSAQNTYQAEELASHGYVVAALQHPYGALVTIFADGTLIPQNPRALPRGVPEAEYYQAANLLVTQWSQDLGYTLDVLAQMNQADPAGRFTGRLDLDQVGLFGHSTGGGAVIEFCAHDSRCQAALGLDAYLAPLSGQILAEGLQQPSLFLYSELWPSERNEALFAQLYSHMQGAAYAFTILGTDHYDFTDLPLLSPLAPQLGLKGPLNGQRALRIINDYSLDFFNRYLRQQTGSLLPGPSPDYPEVVVKTANQ